MKHFKLMVCMCLIIFQACKTNEEKVVEEEPENLVSIYTIGDSTMADKPEPETNPERGWCQMLPTFLNEKAVVKNHAVNGRSSRSFINEHRWDSVLAQLQAGDYVFIQFGHNDQKENDPVRYTNPTTAYRNNLIKFVEETRAKNALPVLFTSIVRRHFNTDSSLIDTHGAYPLQVRMVANEYDVPLIDLQYATEKLEETYGFENSKKLHLHYQEGEIPYYPNGKEDNTHLSVLGATEVAKLAVEELRRAVPNFNRFLKP